MKRKNEDYYEEPPYKKIKLDFKFILYNLLDLYDRAFIKYF